MAELDAHHRRSLAIALAYTEKFTDAYLGAAQRIVPLEEGTLGASADRETHATAGGVVVRGFFATVYAAKQERETSYVHRAGRQAHYLESSFKAAIPRYAAGLAAALRVG